MGLTKYKQKRDFKQTSEPEGKIRHSKKELIFVVQKHAASHLHYDFRLEMDGVLKSWAVPKGPSLNPEDKRLAMMVEDHPYSYKDFEGNIPEGNYGAGNVIVWDNGTYTSREEAADAKEAEKKLRAGLMKGHITFVLSGKKLKGEFALVKLNGKQENAWLLIKKDDKYASESDITKKNKSIISGLSLEQLENKNEKKKPLINKRPSSPSKKSGKKISAGKHKAEFISPMLATLTDGPFDREGWVFEIKFDGYRAIAVLTGKNVELYSRNHLRFTETYKPVAEALKHIQHTAVLDGELVVEDAKGRSHFQLLQNFQRARAGTIKYYVFDLLNLDGHDTRKLPLLERKELLKMLLSPHELKNIIYSGHVEEKGLAFFKKAQQKKLEGIIAKDGSSIYKSGKRSSDWLKIKITLEEEAVIAGFTDPKGSRKHFGSLVLAQYKGKELKYIGNCGTGFTESGLKELYAKFKTAFSDKSPIKEKINPGGKVQWLKPRFVCQVRFTERTGEGLLRHPVFLGLRVDKPPKSVTTIDQQKIVHIPKKKSS